MKSILTAAATAFLLAAVAPASAAPGDAPPPPRSEKHDGGRHDRDGGRRDGPRGGSLLDVAGKLAAAEIALGITEDQREEWRAFATAMVDFVDAGRPDDRSRMERDESASDDDGPDAGDEARDGRKLTDLKAFGMLDRMVDATAERAAAGQALRQAATRLSDVMTPEQVDRAEELLRSARPDRRDRWMGKGHDREDRVGRHHRWMRGPAE